MPLLCSAFPKSFLLSVFLQLCFLVFYLGSAISTLPASSQLFSFLGQRFCRPFSPLPVHLATFASLQECGSCSPSAWQTWTSRHVSAPPKCFKPQQTGSETSCYCHALPSWAWLHHYCLWCGYPAACPSQMLLRKLSDKCQLTE